MNIIMPTEAEILKMMAKRDKVKQYASTYRAKHKEALLAYNREYFEKKKGDVEFIKKQRESISNSKKKRRIENKKGEEGKPVRAYIKNSQTLETLGESIKSVFE